MAQPIDLATLLASRDCRRDMQRRLLSLYPDSTLVVMTVVMPGSIKQTRASAIVADAGLAALCTAFKGKIRHRLLRDLTTGYEAYFCVDAEKSDCKRTGIEIEEKHPLGRLMDIDVIDTDGVPLSREAFYAPPRRCLICNRPARECMRAARHSPQEIQQFINRLCDDFI